MQGSFQENPQARECRPRSFCCWGLGIVLRTARQQRQPTCNEDCAVGVGQERVTGVGRAVGEGAFSPPGPRLYFTSQIQPGGEGSGNAVWCLGWQALPPPGVERLPSAPNGRVLAPSVPDNPFAMCPTPLPPGPIWVPRSAAQAGIPRGGGASLKFSQPSPVGFKGIPDSH